MACTISEACQGDVWGFSIPQGFLGSVLISRCDVGDLDQLVRFFHLFEFGVW